MPDRQLDRAAAHLLDDDLDVVAEHEGLAYASRDEEHVACARLQPVGMRANARLASRAKLTPTDAGRDRALPTGLPRRSWLAVAPALVLALLVLAVAPAAFANDVATAQKVVKDVFGGGNMYRVTERRTLPFRELINTGAESGATFRFVDETVLSVGENAELRLDEFVFDPSTKGIRGAASMTRGALRFVGSAAAKDVSIRTPAGTLGIRGTAFTLRVDGSLLELDVQEGQVSLVAGGAATVVRQGEFVSVRAGVAGVQRGQPGPAFRAAIAQIVRSLGAAPQRAAAPGGGPREVRDAAGRPVGFLVVQANGRVDAQDAQRRLVAFYDPAQRATFGADGRRIGDGDRLEQVLRGAR
jgi:ferric-dicitrate binding protein FerR (iron transport regulator)